MQNVLVLVGRPNVGKSTLFNYLTKSRNALVGDFPGLTRDRQFGFSSDQFNRSFVVVDTGGAIPGSLEKIDENVEKQRHLAYQDATHLLLVLDGSEGITTGDVDLAEELRKLGKPISIAVNKTDISQSNDFLDEVYSLGLGEPYFISAKSGAGVQQLVNNFLPSESVASIASSLDEGIRIAFVGRPNVGKSTLVNRILGEERVISMDAPGTTRDSIHIPFVRDNEHYTLIDTAGVRRRSRVNHLIEKYSIVKTLQSVRLSDVVIMMIDAREGVTDQDAHLIGLIVTAGTPLVLALNKWDHLEPEHKEIIKKQLDLKLRFLDYVERYFISARHGTGVGHLFEAIKRAHSSASVELTSSYLTRLLEQYVETHQPPLSRGRRIKLRFAHPGGKQPLTIVIHGTQTNKLPESYRQYLINAYRRSIGLVGVPLTIEFRNSENPYSGKRDKLTPRQKRTLRSRRNIRS